MRSLNVPVVRSFRLPGFGVADLTNLMFSVIGVFNSHDHRLHIMTTAALPALTFPAS
jgi:hypothetical protein